MKTLLSCLLPFFIVFLFFPLGKIFAQSSSTVNATVKISICGNNIIEGNEDCEGDNLNSNTCQTLNYQNGTLVCDISCSFDKTDCSGVLTPTPTPTVSTDTNTSISPIITSPVIFSSIIEALTKRVELPSLTPDLTLPSILQAYDRDFTGKIEADQMFSVVSLWVEEWKDSILNPSTSQPSSDENSIKKCDIDSDGLCNLKDFSVLMYYFEK